MWKNFRVLHSTKWVLPNSCSTVQWLADCVPWQAITTRAAVTTQRTSEQKQIRVFHVLTIASQKETRSDSEKLDVFSVSLSK